MVELNGDNVLGYPASGTASGTFLVGWPVIPLQPVPIVVVCFEEVFPDDAAISARIERRPKRFRNAVAWE